jgi:hypothetical protein
LRDQQRCRDWVIRDILCESAASDALVFVTKGRPRKRLSAPAIRCGSSVGKNPHRFTIWRAAASASGRNAS